MKFYEEVCDDILRREFPHLFKECWEISFGIGWLTLVRNLCHEIQKEMVSEGIEKLKNEEEDFGQYGVFQIKEKLGGLRFYANTGSKNLFPLINAVEEESLKTCEVCSRPGSKIGNLRDGDWIKTLCSEHGEIWKKRNEK